MPVAVLCRPDLSGGRWSGRLGGGCSAGCGCGKRRTSLRKDPDILRAACRGVMPVIVLLRPDLSGGCRALVSSDSFDLHRRAGCGHFLAGRSVVIVTMLSRPDLAGRRRRRSLRGDRGIGRSRLGCGRGGGAGAGGSSRGGCCSRRSFIAPRCSRKDDDSESCECKRRGGDEPSAHASAFRVVFRLAALLVLQSATATAQIVSSRRRVHDCS